MRGAMRSTAIGASLKLVTAKGGYYSSGGAWGDDDCDGFPAFNCGSTWAIAVTVGFLLLCLSCGLWECLWDSIRKCESSGPASSDSNLEDFDDDCNRMAMERRMAREGAKVVPIETVSPPMSPPASPRWPAPQPFVLTIPADEQLAEPEQRYHGVGVVMRTTIPVGCTDCDTFPVMTALGAYEVACPPGVLKGEAIEFLVPMSSAPDVAVRNGPGSGSSDGSAALGGTATIGLMGFPADVEPQGGRSKAE